jgi:hypothetical protein
MALRSCGGWVLGVAITVLNLGIIISANKLEITNQGNLIARWIKELGTEYGKLRSLLDIRLWFGGFLMTPCLSECLLFSEEFNALFFALCLRHAKQSIIFSKSVRGMWMEQCCFGSQLNINFNIQMLEVSKTGLCICSKMQTMIP